MEFEKLISERYSVRSFKPEHLSKETIDKILAAGHLAPTGCNFQPQRILVLNTEESLEKLKTCTKCHFNAPTAMLICHNKEESWKRRSNGELSSYVDASIVTTYMMLAAHNIGVGTCWVMAFEPDAMRENFNIPENIDLVALLVMGYPADDATPLDMHYKFRPIEDVVLYEKF